MYIHVGNNKNVRDKDIIAVLDLDTATLSKTTREFLAVADEEGFVETICNDIPKAAVICELGHNSRILLCPVASSTIKKRYLD